MFLIYFVNCFFFFVCVFVEYLSFKMINVMYTYINIFVIDVIHLEYLYSMCIYFKSYWCVKNVSMAIRNVSSFAFYYLVVGLGGFLLIWKRSAKQRFMVLSDSTALDRENKQ